MATVIDALVMTLGLETKDYDKNYKRALESQDKFKKQADAMAKSVAEGGKVMAEGFAAVKRELLGVLAVLGVSVGLKDFIASSVTGQAALGRLSKNLGISAKSLEAWGLVAKEMGGQASDAFGALQAVAGGLAEASIRGHSALTDMARANGVALTDARGKVLGYEDALISISKRMSELPRQQAMYLANQLGVGSMFNELMLGPDELRKRLDAARGMTRVTDASTASAARLQRQWADIQQRFKEAGEVAFTKLSPVLERLAERFANWLDSVDWDKVVQQITSLFHGVNDVVKAFGGWKTVAIAVGSILALKVLSPVLGLVAGLARLGPLLVTTTAGLTGLAAAGAGLAGWGVGTAIHRGIAGSKLDNAIGSTVANVMSFFGNQTATDAVVQDMWSKRPRGLRNNNPGNLNFAGQAGATRESGPGGRFAVFGTMQEGIAALIRQLALYTTRGIDTIKGIVNKYAPAGDGNNVAAYIGALMKATGKGANEHLDLANMGTLIPLVQGISKHEGNGYLSPDQILGGVRLGASQSLASRAPGAISNSTRTSETHIGRIEVHTQAADAQGIARDVRGALQNHALVASADTGLD